MSMTRLFVEQCRYRASNPGFDSYQGSTSNSLYPAPFPNMFQGSDVVPSSNVHFNYPTHSMQGTCIVFRGMLRAYSGHVCPVK